MRFRVLGSVEAWAGESRLALGGPRQVALLAFFLVTANRPVVSDALIDTVWGSGQAGAEQRLWMAIARLRKALAPLQAEGGGPVLRTLSGGYWFSIASGELDAEVFESGVREGRRALEAGDAVRAVEVLEGALGLWRGPALAEVRFEDFAQGEVRRLEELRRSAFETLIDAELELGHHAAVIPELKEALATDPTRERLVGQLMFALYRSGRQADALSVYQRTRVHLDEELGLEPSEELKALQVQILEHAPSLGVGVAGPLRGERRSRVLPSGTVTFVFTDVEGSAGLLRERYRDELEFHRGLVRGAVAAHGGVELGTEGDGFLLAFERAADALEAAGALQALLADRRMRLRIGLHTGEPLLIDGGYVGLDVHKAARICDAAHGGQVLVSQAVRDLNGDGLHELGEFRLKDLTAPERLFQLGDGEFPTLRTLRPTNLPIQPGPLLGRRNELAHLLKLAADNRLVTLTGPGGSGKTRLSLALAGEVSGDYRDGAWWVPLAAVTDPELVPATIAQSLGARGELQDHLAGKQIVLLLDNLEQVLHAAPLIAELLGGLPELSVIATSRERLAVSFEQEYPVPPLDEATAEELFVSRARQLEPDFEPDETVGEICERLDRLPLALELASTRVKVMSTAQMLDRLEHRLDLLGKGRRDAPGRQATMRATIGWSYDLLPDEEQGLFRQLGVFAGSFELETAEAVCDADLDSLQSLVEKSLLRRDGHGRFFLLELTREYALEQLDAAGETEQLRRRHAASYLGLARRADEHLSTAEQGVWFARLDGDTDNFRAVLAWCSEHDPGGAIELATTLHWAWRRHGRLRELASWLERVLATPGATDLRTRALGLRTYGETLLFVNEPERANEAVRESLNLSRTIGDKQGEAWALLRLGGVRAHQGSIPEAIELQEAALEIFRQAGDPHGIEVSLGNLGALFCNTGDLERSEKMWNEAIAICTELGDHHGLAYNLTGLGAVAVARNDPDVIERHYRDALDEVSGLGDERFEMCCVAAFACVAALRGNAQEAGRLWGIAETAENRGMDIDTYERALCERIITPLQDDQAFQAGYQAGRELELAEAVGELRELSESD
jgi:predicted ATPase/DNA-binding SARP family transcriptional activator